MIRASFHCQPAALVPETVDGGEHLTSHVDPWRRKHPGAAPGSCDELLSVDGGAGVQAGAFL
ncbi:hypothetical protein P4O66_008929 [Electrophorus voltai]|uniref:Uncharacterized protein n=1 Tax=Electrophorus voltai TaxID=2609070 RepID=A0AAD9DXK8_9TELE|nr:hypothetical protein P4O66_008929 [Electrophorus voltai]